jgi:aminopeptidase N
MNGADDRTVCLKDYRPPDYRVDSVELAFELDAAATRVRAALALRRYGDHDRPLVLDGELLELKALALDGRPLRPPEYGLNAGTLAIPGVPAGFRLETEVEIHPERNTALSGLYASGGNLVTQCEAEGFRRIIFFPDRPDVLSRYTVTLVADRAKYPVLLSNGNLVEERELPDGRRLARWQDPFPKPSYLFALVAGELSRLEDEFVTRSGRKVRLLLYARPHNIGQCGFAMECLKRAMRWDEERYGREYDLERYMIVAVDDFNMGAMENKGLNVFNARYVLADADTATDSDYQHIEGVIAHEYFHNWSGNRVTCRDWFQLSLKEGFTVLRDQQFSADMGSPGVRRVQEVNLLRTHQFREDAGPLAHAVRPPSYREINNFYTTTVYNKGAEVIRMLYRLLGPEGYRRGTDLYFARHDGQAATTDDFVRALEDACGADLGQFRLWYEQAGTPRVTVRERFEPHSSRHVLVLSQTVPPTPGQPDKAPMHIPVAVALFDAQGGKLPLRIAGEETPGGLEAVLSLRQNSQEFAFEDVSERPVVSLLRGFSAPVALVHDRPEADLYFLMAHDDDPFVRWDSAQRLALRWCLDAVAARRRGEPLPPDPEFVRAFRTALMSGTPDRAFLAELLRLPSESYLADALPVIDPDAVHAARRHARLILAQSLAAELRRAYDENRGDVGYRFEAEAAGRRALKNLCLAYLVESGAREARALALTQFEASDNMTDRIAALGALVDCDCQERRVALDAFHERHQGNPLVMDKWLSLQATCSLPGTLGAVRALTSHPAFDARNPNRVRALIGGFAHANPVHFHRGDGSGYEFVAGWVLALDSQNPQLAARLAGAFSQWRRYDEARQGLMRAQLERIAGADALSRDSREIVEKSLGTSE